MDERPNVSSNLPKRYQWGRSSSSAHCPRKRKRTFEIILIDDCHCPCHSTTIIFFCLSLFFVRLSWIIIYVTKNNNILKIGCCGSYSSLDYINVNKAVPKECRDPNTGNEYLDGCYIRFSRYLENRTGWIAGLSLFLAVLQVLIGHYPIIHLILSLSIATCQIFAIHANVNYSTFSASTHVVQCTTIY